MEKKDWILVFLYSKGVTDNFSEPINGSVRIMKDLFLLWKEGDSLDNIYNNFEKYLYGPCDFSIYTDLKLLKKERLVEEIANTGKNFSKFRITKKGIEFIKPIHNNLLDTAKQKIRDIKRETNSRKHLIDLLKYIYGKYPDWAENSLLKID